MLQVDDAGKILFTDDTTVQCIISTHTFIYIRVYIHTRLLFHYYRQCTVNVSWCRMNSDVRAKQTREEGENISYV